MQSRQVQEFAYFPPILYTRNIWPYDFWRVFITYITRYV